ncbi:MAG: hypothetical protein SOR61_01785 [Evtepia sp.]|uniref:hypothetical protein n=1 Tax=Evtepia sp. TaxID=2773933 RepID=UPI002A752AB1|nr:hypothetical protein [Evtepia sp.]MDY3013929.1 hypothetical protein [Evtepia sp.]
MEKAVVLPAAAGAAGIAGLIARWLYLDKGFEVGTGLPLSVSAPGIVMWILAVAVVAVCFLLGRGSPRTFAQCYTGAFTPRRFFQAAGQMAAVVLLAAGGFLNLAAYVSSPVGPDGAREEILARLFLGVLCLLAAAGIYLVLQLLRKGTEVRSVWLSVPGFACCLWVMLNYYASWAEDPIVARYVLPLAAGLLTLVACCLIPGFAYGKGRVTLTLVVSLTGAALNLFTLADGTPLYDTAVTLGLTFYLLAQASILADNANRPEPPEPPACPSCSGGCAGCAGCGGEGQEPNP